MKKLISILLVVLLLTLSGCQYKSKDLGVNEKYTCVVYVYNDEIEYFDNVKSWKLVDNTFNTVKNGVYLTTFDDEEFYYLGYKYNIICKKTPIIK